MEIAVVTHTDANSRFELLEMLRIPRPTKYRFIYTDLAKLMALPDYVYSKYLKRDVFESCIPGSFDG